VDKIVRGGASSLVITPDLEEAPNAQAYGDRLVRFYVGLEDPQDLIDDIDEAFRPKQMSERPQVSRAGSNHGRARQCTLVPKIGDKCCDRAAERSISAMALLRQPHKRR
jgi:hypothetical protein